ncbi:sugar transferase [Candidatus Gottesmanbacteria bacterium]|nr:sugar transferase [Candidatus Gottesmanbacteria bacterium]
MKVNVNIIFYKVFVLILFFAMLPLMIFFGVLIYLFSGWPVFFIQKRVGKNGKVFEMIKFRTMTFGAHAKQRKLIHLNEADGPVFKIRNDPRFTTIGRFISHMGLDELPQLFNVLKGEMALIGPRPLPVDEEKKLKPWMRARARILPGIISPWVLDGYHTKSFDEWMNSDCEYAKTKSFQKDLILEIRAVEYMVKLIGRATV